MDSLSGPSTVRVNCYPGAGGPIACAAPASFCTGPHMLGQFAVLIHLQVRQHAHATAEDSSSCREEKCFSPQSQSFWHSCLLLVAVAIAWPRAIREEVEGNPRAPAMNGDSRLIAEYVSRICDMALTLAARRIYEIVVIRTTRHSSAPESDSTRRNGYE